MPMAAVSAPKISLHQESPQIKIRGNLSSFCFLYSIHIEINHTALEFTFYQISFTAWFRVT